MEAGTQEAIILWWTKPGGSERAGFRIGFEGWMGFADGIIYGGIKRGVKEDWKVFWPVPESEVTIYWAGMSMRGTDL